jgi:hypothetical protein
MVEVLAICILSTVVSVLELKRYWKDNKPKAAPPIKIVKTVHYTKVNVDD